MNSTQLFQTLEYTNSNNITSQETISPDICNDKQYIIVDWYLQQHGSFSSCGRSRDISLTQFSSTQHLLDYLSQYIKQNYQHVNITNRIYSVLDLCQIAIDESNKLLVSNSNEISRVTSRHIWPPRHKLIMGCLVDAHIIATSHDENAMNASTTNEEENDNTTYCFITQLGNRPTHVKFIHGTKYLREEIFQRFHCPFQTTSQPTPKQIELFRVQCETLSIQSLCHYVTSQHWREIDSELLHGVLVDFIVAGKLLLFSEQVI